MKILFLSGMMFFSLILNGQSSDSLTNKFDINGKKTGKWIEYMFYEGDSIKIVNQYLYGQLNGKSVSYFPNGQIECMHFFKNGIKEGVSRFFYKSGVISDIFLFVNGETKYHIRFDTEGGIFQESDGGGNIQYNEGKPITKLE